MQLIIQNERKLSTQLQRRNARQTDTQYQHTKLPKKNTCSIETVCGNPTPNLNFSGKREDEWHWSYFPLSDS